MEFLIAKAELKKLANGKYHSITYELIEYAAGEFDTKCGLYIDPRISSSGITWEEALNKIKTKLGIIETKVDLSEAPGEEKGKAEK